MGSPESVSGRCIWEGKELGLDLEVKEFIFGDERPFASCHASTVLVFADGDILAAWFGGSQEGAEDVAIWLSRRSGGRWQAPRLVADAPGVPHWNPVLFQADDGTVHLFYKVGHPIPRWQTMVTKSNDGGRTWSQPQELVAGDVGGRGPVKNKPIAAADGAWLAPASVEGERWDAFVDISRDGGQTWTKSATVPLRRQGLAESGDGTAAEPNELVRGKGVIQPTLWESAPGVVHMLLRSTEAQIYRSDSCDGGLTWCTAYPTALPNNNSGIDLVRMDSGALVLAYNPVPANWGPRSPLVLAVSTDNGQTWRKETVLEEEPGEFSYPAIVAKGDQVYLTYTWNRERIVFCQLSQC